jgi:hypothetical protein
MEGVATRRRIEPRIWLGTAVVLLLVSLWPYWLYVGLGGVLINAALALGAAAALWLNWRGEKRLARDAAERDGGYPPEAIAGAPSSTSGAGTSTEPSSRW